MTDRRTQHVSDQQTQSNRFLQFSTWYTSEKSLSLLAQFYANHGTYIRWLLRTCCVRMKESRSSWRKNTICDSSGYNQMLLADQLPLTHPFLTYILIKLPWCPPPPPPTPTTLPLSMKAMLHLNTYAQHCVNINSDRSDSLRNSNPEKFNEHCIGQSWCKPRFLLKQRLTEWMTNWKYIKRKHIT